LVGGDLLVGEVTGLDVHSNIVHEGEPVVRISSAKSGFATDLNANLEVFLGFNFHSGVKLEEGSTYVTKSTMDQNVVGLCKPIDDYGKAAIMQLSNDGILPRFSKYSGALEWSNCVYLWVNVGGASGYSNSFTEAGRHMMWFGGSKMHQGTLCQYGIFTFNNWCFMYVWYVCVYECMCVYVCMYVCMYICMYVYVCMYVCMYVCIRCSPFFSCS
jgi:hypothetical protein